jgi:hypothetical protein
VVLLCPVNSAEGAVPQDIHDSVTAKTSREPKRGCLDAVEVDAQSRQWLAVQLMRLSFASKQKRHCPAHSIRLNLRQKLGTL